MAEKNNLDKEEKKRLKAEKTALEIQVSKAKIADMEAKLAKYKEKAKEEDENTQGLFGTSSEPRKSMSTYLRNLNNFEVSLISILDQKSSIIISICTTLISVLIAFNSYIQENVVFGNWMSGISLVGLMISLVAAILATKPDGILLSIIFKRQIKKKHMKPEETIFITSGSFSLEEYEDAMAKVVQNQDLQIGNQIRASYLISKNNMIKSAMIDFSYNAFLITFLIVGMINLISKFQ